MAIVRSSTPVWLIHTLSSGEQSVRVLLWTRDHGLIWALYKGGKTLKKQQVLQAFTPLWVDLKLYPSGFYVNAIESASTTPAWGRDLFYSALYLNELLYHALQLNDAYPQLYDAYGMTLMRLNESRSRQTLEPILRRFEWTLLSAMGYGFSLTVEAKTGQLVMPNHAYLWQAGEGLILAEQGILGAHILAMSQDHWDDIEVLKSAKQLMRSVMNHALGGKEIQTRRLFATSFAR